MVLRDRLRCKLCYAYLLGNGQCPKCDRALAKYPKGETNSGDMFGDMSNIQLSFGKMRNSQIAKYSGEIRDLDRQINACKYIIHDIKGLTQNQQHAFKHVFDMVNIGRYYLHVQLKETANLLVDSGLAKLGEDLWGLGSGIR